jgi:hypothetical protein
VDWRLDGGHSPLSLDMSVESLSSRVGNSANTLAAPPRATVNLGLRYRLEFDRVQVVIRPYIVNVLDKYGWTVSTSGGWTYTQQRSAFVSVAAEL